MDKKRNSKSRSSEINNLNKSFDDNFFTESSKNSVMAVNDTISNKRRRVFWFSGREWSGKSTIAKMIVNLFKPTTGDIFFDNVCITKINRDLS